MNCGHFGLNGTRSHLRNNYWIPKVATLIKKIVDNCKICAADRVQRYHVPDSPPLPEFRFDYDKPFNFTCLDMTGSYNIKEKDNTVSKYYLIIFICAATGCGHVEIVADATSVSFANAFERFVSRRGCPQTILSDHGSNFKGFYSNELRLMSEQLVVKDCLKAKGIDWLWTPIGDPHFNGLVERQLGIIKKVIKKTVGQKLLNIDEFATVVAYAECIFNERPLCELVNDPDFLPITPNLLVYGYSHRHFNHSLSDLDLNDPNFKANSKEKLNARSIKLRSNLASIRKIFTNEYLALLADNDASRQKNSPSTKSIIVPKKDDFVAIKGEWGDIRIGKIIELKISDDGQVRQAYIQTKNNVGWYSINNIRLLEFHSENLKTIANSAVNVDISTKVERPKRKAALEAQKKFLISNLIIE